MKTLKIILVVLVTLTVVVVAGFFLIGYLKPKPSGLMVDTVLRRDVYINGNFVGKTPYTGTNPSGQIDLKLVPDITDQGLLAYETKVNLVSGIQTVVTRQFGTSEDLSSGDVVSFDNTGIGIVVISTPDNSQIYIDGVAQGFSPYKFNLNYIWTPYDY